MGRAYRSTQHAAPTQRPGRGCSRVYGPYSDAERTFCAWGSSMSNPSGWHRKRPGAADAVRKRKYDSAEHRAARREVARLVAAGLAQCWRCGTRTAAKWHAGHNDGGDRYMGPECSTCNLRAAARKGALIANARRAAARHTRPFTRPTR